jgi:hypothetical protein
VQHAQYNNNKLLKQKNAVTPEIAGKLDQKMRKNAEFVKKTRRAS